MRYRAFISYGSSTADVAHRLHQALERYRIPRSIRGQASPDGPIPQNLKPVFLDRAEFRGSPDLSREIASALEESQALVVLCSPSAAASPWVDLEIRNFKALGRENRVFAVIVDPGPRGVVKDVFPRALRERTNADGSITEIEPLAADIQKDGFHNATLKLIAGILGVGYDALKQRDKARQRRIALLSAFTALLACLALAIGYVITADRSSVPWGGETIRRVLDRHEIFLARPVSSASVAATAADKRRPLIPIEMNDLDHDERVLQPPAADGRRGGVWQLGQMLASIAGAPETTPRDIALAKQKMEFPFTPGQPIVVKDVAYGWISYRQKPFPFPFPQAEASLWPIIALSEFLKRDGALTPEERARYIEYLRFAQRSASLYYNDGGWMHFPNQTNPKVFGVYTSIIGLEALLAVREARQDWPGNNLDEMIAASAKHLIDTYDYGKPGDPGWHGAKQERDVTPLTSLTLFAYSAVLRAAAALPEKVQIPPPMLSNIAQRVPTLGEITPLATDVDIINAEFVDRDGQRKPGFYDWKFPEVPPAIACTLAWLSYLQTTNADNADVVGTRRVLGKIVERAQSLGENREDFYRAELLWILDRIR